MHRIEFNVGQYHLTIDVDSAKTYDYKHPLFWHCKNDYGNGVYIIIGHFEMLFMKKYYKNTSKFFFYI